MPHTEVDRVEVDDAPVGLAARLHGGERVAVHAARVAPTDDPRFVLDVHLGRLAAFLRLLGFDCVYRNDLHDPEIVAIAESERRIALTRDVGLLKNGGVARGAFVHATDPVLQLREVLDRFALDALTKPFSRCVACNGAIGAIAVEDARARVPAGVADAFDRFGHCASCDRVFWSGSHCDRLRERFAAIGVALP